MAATKIQLSQIQKTAGLFVTQPAKHTELNAPRECETIDWWHMTSDQRKRALRLIAHPPRGSKLASAKKYGVDLTLLVENLSLTPTERAKKLSNGAKALQQLRRSGERHRSKK
jgi:hypothetical protein